MIGICSLTQTIRFKSKQYHYSSTNKQKLLDQAIQRFVSRLNLPDGLSFKLISCKENVNENLIKKFNVKKRAYKILQLYHAIIDADVDASKSICANGFFISHFYGGNKGKGVYLANHSRYSWNWASPRNPVIICDVIADSELVKRYRSEIYSPVWNSEYVVNNPELVYPKYVLKYEIEGKITDPLLGHDIGYVKIGKFGCASCDSQVIAERKGVRCDCELVPVIDPRDIVNE